MPEITVRCACGRPMTLDSLRGPGAFRCRCGSAISVVVSVPPHCAGYQEGARCRDAVVHGLPVDLCKRHATEFARSLASQLLAVEDENLDEELAQTLQSWEEKLPADRTARNAPCVYYMRFGDRVKIGTTTNLLLRLEAIPHDELLATEPGSMALEKQRHKQFKLLQVNGEWFRHTGALAEHIAGLRETMPAGDVR